MTRALAGQLILFALLGTARLEDAPQVDEDGHVIDPFAGHERLVECAKLEEESDEDDAADACLQAVKKDESLPCEVRALAMKELALGSTTKKKSRKPGAK